MYRLTSCLVAGAIAACLALAGCSGRDGARTCKGPSDCPADARCRADVCVTNSAPVAAIAPLASPATEFELLTLSGEGSGDPDAPDDAIASYRWTVAAKAAPCEAPVIAGTLATAKVRFGCAGSYEVSLVAVDGMGAESAPATLGVDVGASSGTRLVSAGSDTATGHRCDGDPLLCHYSKSETMPLQATGPGSASYHWTAQPPPGLDLVPGRRVFFLPNANVATPAVRIETDGLAMSGDWVFRVEASDEFGVVGADSTRISIGNQVPVVSGLLGPVPHTFSSATQAFEARGDFQVTVTDPDGDPVTRAVTTHQLNAGAGATFTASEAAGKVTYQVKVPFAGMSSGMSLIGAPGLARDVELTATDVNGASAKGHWDLVVTNRPPVRDDKFVADTVVEHTFSAAQQAYLATAHVSSWADPDGDPLEAVPGVVSGPCSRVALVGALMTATCSVPYTGVPAAALIAGTWPVQHSARDPWETASTSAPEVTVLDHAPTLVPATFSTATTCTLTPICCDFDVGGCIARERTFAAMTLGSGGTWLTDPDGDPMLVTFSAGSASAAPGSLLCTGADCVATFSAPIQTTCGAMSTSVSLGVSANDGGQTTTGTIDIALACK
ncbi:MAG: hypothetical protein QM704_03650 [Anaeromyxobacteraceae bacterium]